MTRNCLFSWRPFGESQVPNKRAHCNCDHDLPIIRHEEQPKPTSQQARMKPEGLLEGTHTHHESSPLLVGRANRAALVRKGKLITAALYAIQVFYSFFIM